MLISSTTVIVLYLLPWMLLVKRLPYAEAEVEAQVDAEENEELLPNDESEETLLTNSHFETSQLVPVSESHSDSVLFVVEDAHTEAETKQNRLAYNKQKPHPPAANYISERPPAPIPACIIVLENLEEHTVLKSQALTYHFPASDVVLELLILVESAPSSLQWRTAIRETWKQEALYYSRKVGIIFLVPMKGMGEITDGNDLETESRTFQDMILFHHLSTSSIASGRLIHFLYFCSKIFQYQLLLRTYDFFYVKIKQLLNQLSVYSDRPFVYMGYFRGNVSVGKEESSQGDKWFLCPSLVPHADHSAYVLSSQVVDRLLHDYEYLTYYSSEGGSLGLWLSPHKDIDFVHSIAFDSSVTSRGCRNSFVLSPMDSIHSLRDKHNRLKSGMTWCAEEIDFEPSYEYNWSELPSKCCDVLV